MPEDLHEIGQRHLGERAGNAVRLRYRGSFLHRLLQFGHEDFGDRRFQDVIDGAELEALPRVVARLPPREHEPRQVRTPWSPPGLDEKRQAVPWRHFAEGGPLGGQIELADYELD